MPRIPRRLAILGLFVVLSGAEPAEEGYVPVAPAPAVHAALRSSLKTVQDWIDEKDFASAGGEAQGAAALAHLYAHQGADREWRGKTTTLADACSRLSAAARAKDEAACARLMLECTALLDDLGKRSPGQRTTVKDFKPRGGTKTWMLLMDAAYSDAKTAKNARELEQLAQAIAEEANAARHLRSDVRWRRMSLDVREAALDVAGKARAADLAAARTALKTVYRRCEDCHDLSRKK